MVEQFLEQVSTYAGDIDGLILLIGVIVGFWFLVAQGVLFYFIFKFRKKDGVKAQYIAGEKKEETRWITYPHLAVILFDVVIIVGAVLVWVNVKQTLPPADRTVRVVAQQWAWTFVHPGPDGRLDTEDDVTSIDELHIEEGQVYHFRLSSRDVLHSFSVPVFRLKQDAIPGREIVGWFEATRTGRYDIQCAEMCGIGHGLMPAQLVVESAAEHQEWLAAHHSSGSSSNGSTYASADGEREAAR